MNLLADMFILLLTSCGLFIFGTFFFRYQLFRDFEIGSKKPQFLFAVTFMLSCSMFLLIIFEILEFLQPLYVNEFYSEQRKLNYHFLPWMIIMQSQSLFMCSRSRWFMWKVDLIVMIILLVMIIPFYQFYLILSNRLNTRNAFVGGMSTFCCYCHHHLMLILFVTMSSTSLIIH